MKEIKKEFSLQRLNTFGIGAKAKYFIELSSVEEVIEFVKVCDRYEKILILGGGSNLLFTQDFDGIVIKNSIMGIHVVKETSDHFFVKVGAGVIWHQLVESCIKANFGGIENLSLIPGTVGAAPIQNIGAYGVELKDTFAGLEAFDLQTGKKRYFSNEQCDFGYRDSIFKNELRDKYMITNVLFRLTKEPVINTTYGQIREILNQAGIANPNIRDVSNAIINIRQSKIPDPEKIGNAGSFFKNPVVPQELFETIKKRHTDIPSFAQSSDFVKIPAAWLIDKCGLKGKQYIGAAVHTDQPLVLLNLRNASGLDILELSKMIQEKVGKEFGIKLEPEVRII